MREFAVDQFFRNHPDRPAPSRQHGIGQHAHQADVTGSVNQAQPPPGHRLAKRLGSLGMNRVVPLRRPTKDTDVLNLPHRLA